MLEVEAGEASERPWCYSEALQGREGASPDGYGGVGELFDTVFATAGAYRASAGSDRLGHWLGDIAFGIDLGDDVVHLLMRLGQHFLGLLADLVGAAHGRPEQRIEGRTELGHIFRRR